MLITEKKLLSVLPNPLQISRQFICNSPSNAASWKVMYELSKKKTHNLFVGDFNAKLKQNSWFRVQLHSHNRNIFQTER